jgi:hypothetical protein
MANGQPNIFDYLQRFYQPAHALKMQPVLIMDTSAIIDLEQAFQRQYGLRRSYQFIDQLQESAGGQPLIIIPDGVKEEVHNHKDYIVSGRPEISQQTIERIVQCTSGIHDLRPFMRTERCDGIRYFLRLMYHAGMNGKKRHRDPISFEDWEIIDTAVALGMLGEEQFARQCRAGEENPNRGCYKTAVLSSDRHVYWTIEEAFRHPECVELANYLMPIHVRDYSINGDIHARM